MTVKIGTKFYAPYNDGNPEWEVVGARGADTYNCQITDVKLDFYGTKKVFGGEEIRASIKRHEHYVKLHDENERWWKSQKVGDIVHYREGHRTYVRGVITKYIDDSHRMKPTGLVGNWRKEEIPHWDECGILRSGYYARMVQNGMDMMKPNSSNMYEANPRDNEPDPRLMDRLSLDPGLCSEDQLACRRLNAQRLMILDILQDFPKPDADGNYAPALENMLLKVEALFKI